MSCAELQGNAPKKSCIQYPSEAAGWEDALSTALHALLFTSFKELELSV